MSGGHKTPRAFTDGLEETLIAILLGAMTLITFANVIVRYIFNGTILWGLEATVYLFAWMVLIGASYCVKINAHLGVDVVLNMVSPAMRRTLTLIAVAACLAFCAALSYGAWQYWYAFATERAWYETNDVPLPEFLRFLEDAVNEGEEYEKMPRFIPYAALPIGMFLLTFRFLQVAWRVWTGEQNMIVASHEVEDEIEEAAARANAPVETGAR